MTDLQQIEFGILQEFICICESLNLRYYLICGSALGAAKYGGFIPWDDDIDVALLRSDYELFCSKAREMLPASIFLQNYKTDLEFPFMYSKLRSNNTTFIESGAEHLNINHGCYIDIFPIDGYPDSSLKQRRLELRKAILKFASLSAMEQNPRMKGITRILLKIERICGFSKRTVQINNRLTELLSESCPENSAIWCNHGNWQGKLEYAPREQYGNGSWAIFEGLKVRIPEKYDEYLTQKYGDWRADIPEDQKVGHHYAVVIDLKRPYSDYIEKLPNGRVRIKSREEAGSMLSRD